MKRAVGILIMPSSQNEGSIKNVITIMLDEKCRQKNSIPEIKKILFIEMETLNSSWPKYREILSQLQHDDFEIRCKKVREPIKEIPELIMSAVREVGPENIVLDLTCGLKELTGSLYTAATISGIDNITYTSVKSRSNEEGGGFYDLSVIEDKTGLYTLKRFESIDELESLAAMNSIDFIAYKQMIIELKKQYPESAILEFYCSTLDSAVNLYFSSNKDALSSCVQKIGVMNENFVGVVSSILSDKYSEICTGLSRNNPYQTIEKCQKMYEQFSREKSPKGQPEEIKKLQALSDIFDNLPMFSQLVSTIRIYRNIVSHNMKANITREDAKLCIGIYFKILSSFCKSDMSKYAFISNLDNIEE